MPVRSHGKLLAAIATLCGISLISISCQTPSHSRPRRSPAASPPPPAPQPSYPATQTIASTAPHRPSVQRWPGPAGQSGVAQAGGRSYDPRVVAASAWQPVQHTAPMPMPLPMGPLVDPEQDSATLSPPRIVPMPLDNGLSGQPTPRSPGVVLPPNYSPPLQRRRGLNRNAPSAFASMQQTQKDRQPAGKDDTLGMPRSNDNQSRGNGQPKPPKPAQQPPYNPVNADPRPQVPYQVAGYSVPPDVPREFQKQALPPYVVEPPDILIIQATSAITLPTQPLSGYFLVRPDGTIGLGIYGSLQVAGKTLEQIREMVAVALSTYVKQFTVEQIRSELQVDVFAYNSKFYYVITSGAGWGMQVYPFLATGNETVLDAIAKINGLPPVASCNHMWVARATLDPAHPKILPVDWKAITRCGSGMTNYQIFPGDRVFVAADKIVTADSYISKVLSPIQRLFGATLLGATTVNTIKLGSHIGSSSNILSTTR